MVAYAASLTDGKSFDPWIKEFNQKLEKLAAEERGKQDTNNTPERWR